MTPRLLHAKNVIVQGITGNQGSFHALVMQASGTNIVAGTSPTKAGERLDKIPVFADIKSIKASGIQVDASVIFVPATNAKSAIIEAVDECVPLIVCITEGIPVHDMLYIKQYIKGKKSVLIGPNTPGILIPGTHHLGIIPARFSLPGDTAIISRSGTLTYKAMNLLTERGIGQAYIIGIGGDMLRGVSFIDCLRLYETDKAVKRIIMIGEIGGTDEINAADYIEAHVSKPVYAYIAGHTAPVGVQLGHSGAILGTNKLESAAAKTAYIRDRGITTASSITQLIKLVK